jgi:hypothetical protein
MLTSKSQDCWNHCLCPLKHGQYPTEGLPASSKFNSIIMVVVDEFTKYAQFQCFGTFLHCRAGCSGLYESSLRCAASPVRINGVSGFLLSDWYSASLHSALGRSRFEVLWALQMLRFLFQPSWRTGLTERRMSDRTQK